MATNMSAQQQKRSRASDATDKPPRPTQERVKRRRTSDADEAKALKKTKNTSPAPEPSTGDTPSLEVEKQKSTAPWSFSRPVGGRYSNVNPVMTQDEAYLFIGLDTAVQVFATSTSRLVRTLQMEAGQRVIGYKLCPVDQEILYIFTTGFVTKWDWGSGKRLARWGTDSQGVAVDVTSVSVEGVDQPAAFFVGSQKDGKKQIFINALGDKKSTSIVALRSSEQINAIQVAYGGRVIVACDGPRVFLGTSGKVNLEKPDSTQYTWREATLPVSTTCFHLQEASTERTQAHEVKGLKGSETVDLVLGESNGSILIYQDILNTLFGRNSEKKSSPRRLHWHRGAVNTVKWSKDGNYVISGGNESVLVLWQLDTGRKQFLPHLSSPIVNLIISPDGNSYVVQLADNSVMVLSTRELQPSATMTGLQLNYESVHAKDFAPKKSINAVAALHPQRPEHLLIAVPASHQANQRGQQRSNAAVLQTFDIRSNAHISRQALARTNATTLNIGPEGSPIVAPDIRNMDILHNGKWLATVDSWTPPAKDMKALSGIGSKQDISSLRPEIFLKFWKWSASSNLWELVTRIDGPHFNDNRHAKVLGLTARPDSNEFATLGADAFLRFWCPTTRHRSGLKKDPSEQHQDTWKCRNALDLTGFLGKTAQLNQACISFSEDGSTLAVCLPSSGVPDGLVLLIDVHNCSVHYRRSGVFQGNPYSAKFLGRCLVIASTKSVTVWDIVDDVVKPVQLLESTGSANSGTPLIAVNPRTQTFAVASSRIDDSNNARKRRRNNNFQFHIRIYGMESLDLVFQETLGSCPLALLSDVYSGDYIVVDASSSVQRVGCLDKASQKNVQPQEVTTHLNSGLASIFSRGHERAPVQAIEGDHHQDKGLASVFGDTPSFSLPSLSVLFRNVVQTLGSS